MARQRSRIWKTIAGVVALLFFAVFILPEYLVELLWMENLGFEQVFWVTLAMRIGLFIVGFVFAALFLGGNLFYLVKQLPPLWASRWSQEGEAPRFGDMVVTKGRLKVVAAVIAGFIGLAYGATFSSQWEVFLKFFSSESTGFVEPIFGHDVTFYMLQIPLLELVHGAIVSLVFLTLLIVVTVYFMMGELELREGRLSVRPSVVKHIGTNLIILLVGWSFGYFLDRYELLFSPGPTVYGADYIDHNIMIPALWVMVVASLVLAVVVGLNFRQYRFRLLGYSAAAYVAVMLIGLVLIPVGVRQLIVTPNELSLETPYLENNIEFTRLGYGLHDVREEQYDVDIQLSAEDVENNRDAVDNIRLWDPRLLLTTYRQLQEIRTYYEFYDVDIDRYEVDGEYKQVMVSARELAQTLPGGRDSWQNRHLQYTHGYGAVANLVAQTGDEGTPQLLLQDLPPQSEEVNLQVQEPGIYYGERTPTYSIVNTRARELDYPAGDQNVYTRYAGQGGVQLSSLWRQLLFSWQFSDYNIILSDYLEPESRIQFWNRIQTRVNKVAPFLELDNDPYFVVGNNRQYWVQDAYTTSTHFPYSEHVAAPGIGRINYLRNSVKVVIDAYEGSLQFFVMEEDDPILNVYRSIFPDLFTPVEDMPDTIRDHVRYPQDMFELQVERYNRYHMTDPQTFYNNEDLWVRPVEHYGGRSIQMDPYFVLGRLPGEDRLEFKLITPTTPENRDNMIGWIGARSDFPNYGELVVYQLPPDRLIYGPNQVEARIDQDTEISQQLALWDQRGSRVIRGNLIVVPIERTFLYVEPVFLLAEGAEIPQLQRVIVSHGERVAMERTLDEALMRVVGPTVAGLPTLDSEDEGAPMGVPVMPASEELREARDAMQRARSALERGDFSSFGEEFESLESILNQVSEQINNQTPANGEVPPPPTEEAEPVSPDVDDDGM